MSMLDYFADWTVSVTPRNYAEVDNGSGTWERTPTDSPDIDVVKYNRSAAERLFSQTWSEDVSDVLVVDDITNITNKSYIVFDSIEYSVESGPVNVGEQSDVWTVGLKVQK